MSRQNSSRVVRIAVTQAGRDHYAGGNPGCEANFAVFAEQAAAAAKDRPDLIVTPEYAISGWPYLAEPEMRAIAEPIPGEGKWCGAWRDLAAKTSTPILAWMLERDGENLYNAAVMFDAAGRFVGKYRKVHANLGEQTSWGLSQGESFAPIELDGVRYGTSICSDMWFPETVRCNELLGADVVIHQSVADDMGRIISVRAMDSRLPIVVASFQGGSYAVNAAGEVLDKCPSDAPATMTFELRPFEPLTAKKYGGRWMPKLGRQNVRMQAAYGPLTDPAIRPKWTDVFLDHQGRPQSPDQLRDRFNGRYDARDTNPDEHDAHSE